MRLLSLHSAPNAVTISASCGVAIVATTVVQVGRVLMLGESNLIVDGIICLLASNVFSALWWNRYVDHNNKPDRLEVNERRHWIANNVGHAAIAGYVGIVVALACKALVMAYLKPQVNG